MPAGEEDSAEASAAKRYFYYYGPKLNRRIESPLNSRLNYGYAIIRNSIIKALYSTGLNPAIGLHHTNQYNAFNLADDLIEPFRPMTDLLALSFQSDNIRLDYRDRRKMAAVMRLAGKMRNHKMQLARAVEMEVDSLLSAIKDGKDLNLPQILPLEIMEME